MGGYDARMRWFLALVVGVVVVVTGGAAARAAAQEETADLVPPPRVLVLVERLAMANLRLSGV